MEGLGWTLPDQASGPMPCAADQRFKVRLGSLGCQAQVGGTGIHPSAMPRQRDALGGEAVSLVGRMVRQAVPTHRAGFRGGNELHGSSTSSEAPCIIGHAFFPATFHREHVVDHLVTFIDHLPRQPVGVEPTFVVPIDARARSAIDGLKQPLYGMGIPQCVDAALVGELAVVVAGAVQRDMGVCNVVAQIRSQFDAASRRGVTFHAVFQAPNEQLVRSVDLPWKASRVLGIRQGVAACLDHVPALAPFLRVTFAGQRVEKVHVEVMPWRFERVGVFSSVCRDGPFVEHRFGVAPSAPRFRRQGVSCHRVQGAVRDKSPRS